MPKLQLVVGGISILSEIGFVSMKRHINLLLTSITDPCDGVEIITEY